MGRVSKRKAASKSGMADAAPGGKKNAKYRAGIYTRLSSDLDADKNESVDVQESIARNFVEEYNQRHDERIEIAGCYSDLGKTGSNFNRDGFLRMMQDIRLGEINCVIVKDLSRFGRNYLEAGNYIEKIFPFLGVRFIAVSDGFDTGESGNETGRLSSEIKNLVNDMYAKDFSVKAKTWLQQKRQAGSYVGGPPPYGYVSVWEKKIRKLVPDTNTAGIVRYIFHAFVEKESFTAVADELNRRKVNPPAVYKKTREVYCPAGAKYTKWDKGAIERIVGSKTYIGMLVQGKTSKTARDESCRVHKPEREWTIKENAHEELVSAELFENAQKICAKIRECSASHRHLTQGLPIGENIFDPVLYCGICGRKMTRSSPVKEYADGTRERKEWYFCLDGGQKNNEICPQTNRISRQELTEILLSMLHMEFAVYLEKPGHFAEIGNEQIREAGARIEKEIRSVRAAAGRMDEEEAAIYTDYRAGNVAQEEYVCHKLKSGARRQELESREEELRERLKALEKVKGRYLKAVRSLTMLKSYGEITAEMVCALVEKIYVYPGRRVEIQFRYTNEMLEGVV